MSSENNKRIAQNTLMLYFRMMLMMLVSLYTVRVVLKTLGVVDYGIYNVVGGVVTMFSFLSGTMAAASQRYFSFELGQKNYAQLKKTFTMTMTIYFIIAIVITALTETIGLWFLNTQMTIPTDRIHAANWIFHFSILSFMMTMLTVPYNALIIAHERMSIYAYVSIIEVSLKLLIVYLLVLFSFDKLKLYAVLSFGVTSLVTSIYRTYCQRKFNECRFAFYWDKFLFKEILSYSGWNLFGALAGVFNNQGINILLNIFFGPIVNTARAIAYQTNSAINQFVNNFTTATRPQIIKFYASGDKDKMLTLVLQSSKFSFFLLFLLSMPVLLETKFIFTLWLKDVPDFVVSFTRLMIVVALIDSLSYPLMTTAQATGKIKKYQAVVGGIMLLNLPVSYILFKLSFSPQSTLYAAIIISAICLWTRLYFLKNMVQLSVTRYLIKVIMPIVLVIITSHLLPFIFSMIMDEGMMRLLAIIASSFTSVILSVFLIGLSTNEKKYLSEIIFKRKKKNNEKTDKKNTA